jgi:hypothetical protein
MTLDELGKQIADIDKKVEVLIQRERPSENCRKFVEIRTAEAIRKNEDNKNEYQAIAQVQNEKIKKKVDGSLFWKLIGAAFTFAAGSYLFTWIIFRIIGEVK